MRRWVPAVGLIALLVPVHGFSQDKNNKGSIYEQLNLFDEAFERIRQDAVEPVGDERLVDTAITGMLAGIDPHAAYIPEAEYKAQQAPAAAQPANIGLVMTIIGGQLTVVSPRDGSAAAAAGIKPGDQIYMIDKEPTYDMSLADVEQRLRGPAGSEVTLLLRRGTNNPTDVKVKRAVSTFQSISSHLEDGSIGYIRVAGFDSKTAADLGTAIQNLQQQAGDKLIGFVLDLRNNPGGDFDAAVATADALIDKGDIAIVKGRGADSTKHIAATPGDLAKGLPIVAIVNGGTAEEAELVAGALQDDHRGLLLGTKTFGESGIETTIPISGNGAVRLTTARFLTPLGHQIQGNGITPDLTVQPLKLERLANAGLQREADLPGALKNTDPVAPSTPPLSGASNPVPGTTTKPAAAPEPVATADIGTNQDEQLAEARDVLRGLAMVSARNTR
jgi:carboxyl-terminal processing protease